MSFTYHRPQHRRDFLKTTLLGGASVFLAGCQMPTAGRGSSAPDFHLALLSDTHIPANREERYRGFSPVENLQRAVEGVMAAPPQGAILCGDAARLEGKPEDYQVLRTLIEPLAAKAPVYIGLGNHDDRANFRQAFPTPPGALPAAGGRHITVIEYATVRLVVLDSLLYVNKTAGLLGKEQRAWLAKYLPAIADRPVVLFVHHTLGDGDGELADADRLLAVATQHPHVKAIFYGHSHVWDVTRRAGLHLINLPAVGYNFRDQDPVGWVDARFRADGVTLKLHTVAGNREKDGAITEIRWG